MVRIKLDDVGKRFGPNWLFKKLTFDVGAGEKIALLGHNGSGKSTLIQIISGFIRPTTGSVTYQVNDISIPEDEKYKYISFDAPYIELPEELTAIEFLDFYIKHKSFIPGISPASLIKIAFLDDAKHQPVKSFSSGMKQRLKLACALLSSSEIVLLDEPLTNLDDNGVVFYKNLIDKFAGEKTIIICSNRINDEIFCCTKEIKLDNK